VFCVEFRSGTLVANLSFLKINHSPFGRGEEANLFHGARRPPALPDSIGGLKNIFSRRLTPAALLRKKNLTLAKSVRRFHAARLQLHFFIHSLTVPAGGQRRCGPEQKKRY
jgi:hypothetical protein